MSTRRSVTKAGVWATIVVNDGKLRYCVDALHADVELSQNHFGIVVPEVPHRVEPVGMVRFFVQFYRSPN
jgi:tellurite methyltransferase